MRKKTVCNGYMALFLCVVMILMLTLPVSAANVQYLPDVTEEMTDYRFWADLQGDPDQVILTMDEIKAYNQDTIDASGTMVMDLKSYTGTFDGIDRYKRSRTSAKADAEYYYGWTYDPDTGKLADWSYYQDMLDNITDRTAKKEMPYRYGIAVNRTVLKAFPSDDPIWDDPADVDFDYQSLSSVRVNEPLVIYTTSNDGKYFMARTNDCSGWIAVKDVAVCADREEWLAAWDLPSEDLLVVYGNKIYTETSIYAPETSQRLLTQGTALEIVKDLKPDEVIINRYPYHNYVVYLPVRNEQGRYEKQLALISEKAEVSEGYLPLTTENIAMVTMENLGDTYGWGGMLDVEDCSGMVRTVYSCFGLEIARNGNWQWKMNMEKIDMAYMSLEEKYAVLDRLPLGAALCFPGHEMIYLGKYEGAYYVLSSVGSIMSPASGERLRVRSVIINTLDTKRANGQSWLQAVNQAFMPCYATLEGKTYDFPEAEWYREGVGYVLRNNLIANDENGYFGPNDQANREVAANALWHMADCPEAANTEQFSDVSAEQHNAAAICWAYENEIILGYGNDLFGPADALTREQMITVFWRYAKAKGYDVSVGEETNILSYGDAFEISEYAIPAMQWACGAGILEGRSTQNGLLLDPHTTTTRAELSVMLKRFCEWLETAELLPPEDTLNAQTVAPLPDTTMENLTDAILSVSLEEGGAYVDDNGAMQMDLKIYTYDRYDMVDIANLKVGDTILRQSGEVEVTSKEQNEAGTIYINGGLEAGGFDLVTNDSGFFYEIGFNDAKSWYEIGEATIRVSVDFYGLDNADPELGEVELFPGSFLIGEVTNYDFTPHNTTIRIEDGQIVEMNRAFVP